MGLYAKFFGLIFIPFLYAVLFLLAIGLLRKQLQWFVRQLLKVKILVNGRNLYIFPFIAFINFIAIVLYYQELSEMKEPVESLSRAHYFEKLYHNYRNFLINISSMILIFQIFYSAYTYS